MYEPIQIRLSVQQTPAVMEALAEMAYRDSPACVHRATVVTPVRQVCKPIYLNCVQWKSLTSPYVQYLALKQQVQWHVTQVPTYTKLVNAHLLLILLLNFKCHL